MSGLRASSARTVACCEIRILVASDRDGTAFAVLHGQKLIVSLEVQPLRLLGRAINCATRLAETMCRQYCASIPCVSRGNQSAGSRLTIAHHSSDCSSVRSYGASGRDTVSMTAGSGSVTPSDAADLWTSFSHRNLEFYRKPKRSPGRCGGQCSSRISRYPPGVGRSSGQGRTPPVVIASISARGLENWRRRKSTVGSNPTHPPEPFCPTLRHG